MLNVRKILVRSLTLDFLDIFWEIDAVQSPEGRDHSIYDYDFYVLRSEAAMGPYSQVGGPFRDVYMFRDARVPLQHKWRSFYYKIRVVHRPSGESQEFGPANNTDPEPDLIAAEVIRLEGILFQEFIGRKCWVFPVRTFGPVCTCTDLALGRKTRSNHKTCFGTGWLGGFMSPVESLIQIDPHPKQSHPNSLQELQPGNTTARLTSFPPISPRDVIVEMENRRWRVVSVSNTQRLRSVLHQELVLHEIPKGDIEYDLPLNLDVMNVTPAAERNFSNPQNLEQDNAISDIFKFWGYPRGTNR